MAAHLHYICVVGLALRIGLERDVLFCGDAVIMGRVGG